MSRGQLMLLMSALEMLAVLPMAAFPALVPNFIAAWGLSNAEAGWITGCYYLGYLFLVTFTITLTDRVDARKVFVFGAFGTGIFTLGFGFFADGFWTALVLRALSGAMLAAVYMPGLRTLTDRLEGGEQSRAVSFYTSSYSLAIAAGFSVAGLLAESYGWRIAYIAIGVSALVSAGLAWLLLKPKNPVGSARREKGPGLLAVLKNRAAMGYILAYGAHGLELMAMRGWLTAFLVFALARDAAAAAFLPAPTLIAAIITMVSMPASLLGNECALRFGSRPALVAIMTISGLLGIFFGFTAALPVYVMLVYAVIYYMFVSADSGALTAGMMAVSKPDQRGATMALHSIAGFGGSMLGPLAAGFALDLGQASFGANNPWAWGLGLSVMGFGALIGPVALIWAGRPNGPK